MLVIRFRPKIVEKRGPFHQRGVKMVGPYHGSLVMLSTIISKPSHLNIHLNYAVWFIINSVERFVQVKYVPTIRGTPVRGLQQ